MSTKRITIGTVISKIFFILTTIILIGIMTATICGVAFVMYIDNVIRPSITLDLTNTTMNFSSKIFYKDKSTGEYAELETLYYTENREWASFDEIPQDLKNAFVAIEDERFYEHEGVDWVRSLGAAVNWVIPFRDGFGGGSTITQQLVKNVTQENDYSVTRKIKEILTALDVEQQVGDKDKILELYLNTIYLGRHSYGVKTAALTYFGKELTDLTLAQSAIIAGITNNPSYYDPFRYPENIKERQELILSQMLEQGMISQSEHDEAVKEELIYKSEEYAAEIVSIRSWFADEVITDVLRDLQEDLGYSETMATNLLFSGGLQIYSTIDTDIQDALEAVFEDDENFPGSLGRTGAEPQAAMTIMDPYSGNVLGIVGGREKEANMVLNRASDSERSPGSSIKPISVYGPAIDQGLITPYSVLTDGPFNFEYRSSGWPKNSTGGGGYSGQMTVTRAVELSTNTIAVHVLDLLTPEKSFEYLTENLGLTTLVESETRANGQTYTDIAYAPLALGGLTDGISTKEMTAAYAPFVNNGMYNEAKTYTKVLDANGNVILDNEVEATVAYQNQKTSYYMTYMLERVVDVGTGTAAKITNMATAGKTGTTDEDYDRWFVGYTPYYVAATWFGYDRPEEVRNVSSNPALELWERVMEDIHEGLEPLEFKDYPDSFVSASYCRDSGLAPTSACSNDVRGSRVATGMFHESDVPTEACDLHVSVEIDSVTGMRATEFCPPENVTTASLLDLTRLYPIQITLGDSAYTATINNEPIGSGVASAGGLYNKTCDIHDEHTAAEEDAPDFDPENGLNPEDGSNSNGNETDPDNPEGDENPNEGDETDPEPDPDGNDEVAPPQLPDINAPVDPES